MSKPNDIPQIPARSPAKPVQPTPPATRPEPAGDEVERLRARIAELEARSLTVQAPASSGPPGRFRVGLPGVKVRQVDAEGRVIYQDYLDVDAVTEADAFAKFRQYNGILSSVQTPTIERLGD